MSSLRDRANELAAQQSAQNKAVRQWGKGFQGDLIRNVHKFDIKQTYELLEALTDKRPKYSKSNGEIFKIRFPNTIGGVMTAHGAGRGSTANRTPKDWYGSLLEAEVEVLADIYLEHKGDQALTQIKTQL